MKSRALSAALPRLLQKAWFLKSAQNDPTAFLVAARNLLRREHKAVNGRAGTAPARLEPTCRLNLSPQAQLPEDHSSTAEATGGLCCPHAPWPPQGPWGGMRLGPMRVSRNLSKHCRSRGGESRCCFLCKSIILLQPKPCRNPAALSTCRAARRLQLPACCLAVQELHAGTCSPCQGPTARSRRDPQDGNCCCATRR